MIWNAYQAINNYDWRTSTTSMQIRAQIGPVQGPLGKRGTCGTKAGVSKDVGSAGGSLMIPADAGWRKRRTCENRTPSCRWLGLQRGRLSSLSIARDVRPGSGVRTKKAPVHPHPASKGDSLMCVVSFAPNIWIDSHS